MIKFYCSNNPFIPVLVDDEDWPKVKPYNWVKASSGIIARINGKIVCLNRYILNVTDKSIFVDHKDRDKMNNQKENLRCCDRSQNGANREPHGNRKYKGVFYGNKYKNSWKAAIRVDHQLIYLGIFKTEEDAARAYDEAALKYFKEFAYLNFPKN